MVSNASGRRGIDFAIGVNQSPERQRLLAHEEGEEADEHGCYPQQVDGDPSRLFDPHDKLPVYSTIHRIRRDIIAYIDDPYSLEELRSPRMNSSFVRPMVDQLYDKHDVSVGT